MLRKNFEQFSTTAVYHLSIQHVNKEILNCIHTLFQSIEIFNPFIKTFHFAVIPVFSKCFVFVRVVANYRHVIRKRNR